jgi:uncharacterized protein (DUF58 family)
VKILDNQARRLLDRLALMVRPGATSTRQGGHRSPFLASGVEFADHRPYVPGDDFRRIDWRAFAKSGNLVMRQFEEERDARIYVLLDLSGSMGRGAIKTGDPSKLDIAKRVAASFAYVGMKQFDRAVVVPFGDGVVGDTRPLRTNADLPEVDRFLEGCIAGGTTSLPDAVREMCARFPKRGLCVVVSDLMTPKGFPEGIRTLGAYGHELRVVHVHCPEDRAPSFEGELELTDAETGDKVRLRINKKLLEAYGKEIKKHVDACRDATRRAGGRFVDVPLDLPFDKLIRRAFAGDEGKSSKMAGKGAA